MVPGWLRALAALSLAAAALCAAAIAVDELRRPQRMGIMNVVWPACALFGGPAVLWLYRRRQRGAAPFALRVATGALHCGSGCTLGDICAEWLVFAAPAVAVAFGWHRWFGERMFAAWAVDYLFAYAFGIVFQYFSIAPMRGLSFGRGVWAAAKADTLSLTAWQLGMYGAMAVARFAVFGRALPTDSLVFWFVMQLAMLCGFATAYPMNWWLIRAGVKEAM